MKGRLISAGFRMPDIALSDPTEKFFFGPDVAIYSRVKFAFCVQFAPGRRKGQGVNYILMGGSDFKKNRPILLGDFSQISQVRANIF